MPTTVTWSYGSVPACRARLTLAFLVPALLPGGTHRLIPALHCRQPRLRLLPIYLFRNFTESDSGRAVRTSPGSSPFGGALACRLRRVSHPQRPNASASHMSDGKRPRILCLPTGPDEYAVAVVRALAAVAKITFVLPKAMLARYRDDLPPTVRVLPVRWPRHRDPRNLLLVADARPDRVADEAGRHPLSRRQRDLAAAGPAVHPLPDRRHRPRRPLPPRRFGCSKTGLSSLQASNRVAGQPARVDTVAQRVEFALDCFLTGVGIDYLYVLGRVRRFRGKARPRFGCRWNGQEVEPAQRCGD